MAKYHLNIDGKKVWVDIPRTQDLSGLQKKIPVGPVGPTNPQEGDLWIKIVE